MDVIPLPRHVTLTDEGGLVPGPSPRVAVPSDELIGLGEVVARFLGDLWGVEASVQVGGDAELVLAPGAGNGEEYELVVGPAGPS
ncbi:hypothetical protein [Nonomuraea sp. NPDC052265]|uniref:hypothetical protein n=1 Tax=Nonomuraea sp. NPDC052265 TaxID=3364374 RepID=UPI0037C97E62